MHVLHETLSLLVEIAPRGASKTSANKASILEQDPSMVETAIDKGGKKATLRLKQNGPAVVEEVVSNNWNHCCITV